MASAPGQLEHPSGCADVDRQRQLALSLAQAGTRLRTAELAMRMTHQLDRHGCQLLTHRSRAVPPSPGPLTVCSNCGESSPAANFCGFCGHRSTPLLEYAADAIWAAGNNATTAAAARQAIAEAGSRTAAEEAAEEEAATKAAEDEVATKAAEDRGSNQSCRGRGSNQSGRGRGSNKQQGTRQQQRRVGGSHPESAGKGLLEWHQAQSLAYVTPDQMYISFTLKILQALPWELKILQALPWLSHTRRNY